MNKKVIAIAFSLFFASLVVVPSIVVLVDDTYDISILINNTAEEEESNAKHFEITSNAFIEYTFHESSLSNSLNFHQENYSSLFKELTSPPPEVSI